MTRSRERLATLNPSSFFDPDKVSYKDLVAYFWQHIDPIETAISDEPVPPPKPFVKPDAAELKKRLSAMQVNVTGLDGTEPPFQNEYWDNKQPGIYVDVVSGEPLFSSVDKYDSGTGWPSFTRPLAPGNIVERQDNTLFMERIEVRSKFADSHLGHVFRDGPSPTGLRYCMNSAALRFIPKAELEKEGYEKYAVLVMSRKML